MGFGIIAELYFGATIKKDNSKKLISYYDYIFSQIQVFSFDDDSAKVFALKKSELRKKGCIIEDFDLLIASVAISNSLILVTNNTKHFDRISDLQVVDWMKPD